MTPVSSASLLQGVCVKDSMRECTELMHSGMEPVHLGVALMCQCMEPMCHEQQQPLPDCGSLYTPIFTETSFLILLMHTEWVQVVNAPDQPTFKQQ